MSKKIKVEIEPQDILSRSGALVEMMIIAELKDKGIPIKGTFKFKGVESGTLTREANPETTNLVYWWEDEASN